MAKKMGGKSIAHLQQRQPGQSTEFGIAKRSGKIESPFRNAAAQRGRGRGRARRR